MDTTSAGCVNSALTVLARYVDLCTHGYRFSEKILLNLKDNNVVKSNRHLRAVSASVSVICFKFGPYSAALNHNVR